MGVANGGDVRLGDPPPDTLGWKIGVKSDGTDESQVLFLANCAVSTAGDLHQFIEIAGTRYSHTIDPATGLGLTNGRTTTVIAPTAALSDALATACCVAPVARAESLALAIGATAVHSGLRNR